MRSIIAAWAQSAGATPVYQVPLGQAAAYGLLSGGSLVARNAAGAPLPIQAVGSAGASGAIGSLVAATAGVFAHSTGTVPRALADFQAAQAYCGQPRAQARGMAGQLAGRTLTHGVYTIGGSATLGQRSTVTIAGDTATVVIVNIAGDLTLEAGSRVALAGVLPRHVYWNVAGALHVAGHVAFMGNALVTGDALVDGVQLGYAAILSSSHVTLTNLSPSVGHNRFFAPRGTAGSCANPGPPCAFSPRGSELVIDGSFEAVQCIPVGLSGLSVAPGHTSSDACFWHSATGTTSDYYHQRATYQGAGSLSPDAGVPANSYTITSGGTIYQVPALAQNSRARTGSAYAGIVAQTDMPSPDTYYEYLYQQIRGGLQLNRRYYAEFSAHLAPRAGCTVTKLGLLVEPDNAAPVYPLAGFYDPIPRTPTISGNPRYIHPKNPNPPAQTIADSLNWQRVGGVFNAGAALASASSLRIVIGSFGDATELLVGGPSSGREAYYFIDNVSLSPLTEAGPDVVLGRSCVGSPGPSSATLGTDPMPDLVAATYRWTLPDGTLLATMPNLTVAPAQTTTYVLTVTINGQDYTSQATVTVNNVYAQNAAATYVAPAGIGPADLGLLGGITTLDASAAPYGGRVVFDGTYHVRGTVHLQNGTFELRPGTTFLVDGASGLPSNNASADTDQTTLVVQRASLELSGATLRTSCTGAQWGGVWLDGRGTIRTKAANGIRSQISGAQTGVTSRADNEYYLTGTDFLHNTVGLYELSSNKDAQPREGAMGCVFQDGLYGILLAEGDYQRNAVFGGNYDAATFSANTFSDMTYFGLYATASRGHFTDNTFRTCGWAAMTAWNVPRLGSPEFLANRITVPASGTVLTQHGGPAGIYASDYSVLFANNIIEGAPAPLSTSGNLRVGIDLYSSQGGSLTGPVSGNTFRNLDQGVASLTDDYNGADISITKNFFVNNAADVVLYPWGNQNFGATVTATIRCNSFLNDVYSTVTDPIGIWLKDMAVITTGLETSPNGNEFPAYWAPAPAGVGRPLLNGNINPNNTLKYTFFSQSSNENSVWVSGHGVANPDPSSPLNACGGYAPGVNSQQYQSGILSLSVTTLLAKLDSLSRIGLSAAQQDQLLRSIRRQPAQAIHLPLLEARLTVPGTMTLPNQLAIGLQLLEYYRAQHDQPNTSRLLGWLRQRTPANDELKAYLNLTEATDQMGSFLPGLRPLAATSRTLLSQAAASGTTSARVACRLLRAYEPTCTCVLPASPAIATRPAASPAQTTALAAHATSAQLLTAYPNPASTTLHVPYTLLPGAGMGQLLAYDALGRVVLRQALPARQGEAEVSVQSWPAGLYQLTLVFDGQVQRQQRIAITH